MSGSWEFSGEFKAFNHAKGRGRALSALVAHCQRSPIRSYPNSCSSGLWSTTTAEGRTGGVKCVVTFPQNVFPSLQLSAVWRVAKTYAACLYLIMLNGEKKKSQKPFWLLLFHVVYHAHDFADLCCLNAVKHLPLN